MNKLSLIDKTFLLKRTPLFRTLTLEMLLPIADKLIQVSFDKNDIIFDKGDDAHRMYFIIQGVVEIRDTTGKCLCKLEKDAFFGDEALFTDTKRAYTALSSTDTEILTLSQTNLFTIISEYPSVALGFLSVFASSLPDRSRLIPGDVP